MSNPTSPILPGATIGVLGSGQLGRMFTIAARRMGYRVHTLSPDHDTPTGQVADLEVIAQYDDLDAVRNFAQAVDVVTFEFENVPASTAEVATKYAPVRPSGEVLHITQHRLREKNYLSAAGFPVARYSHVQSEVELVEAAADLGLPAILKTAGFGYDGKGQVLIGSTEQARSAWLNLGAKDAVLEELVDFEFEVSVIAARGLNGQLEDYGVVRNDHKNHILDVTVSPASLSKQLTDEAVQLARAILDALQVVGVLCVEFFVTRKGTLVINELAPRPHNSGHYSFDACVTSQFEQQLRAICGLPLGSPAQFRPAAMANLLGEEWEAGTPNWPAACALGDVKLHLYGKLEPRPGRKMGHLTALADTADAAEVLVRRARSSLRK